MRRPYGATFGDAMIFGTKWVLITIFAATVVVWGWNAWSEYHSALATERALSLEALNQIELMQRQISLRRVELAASRQKIDEQQITIADLGSKLNQCLISSKP